MKKPNLDKLSLSLLKRGFIVKNIKGCFDIVARKEDSIVLIKVLENTNSLTKENVEEMKKISNITKAATVIIAEKSGQKLEDNIIYSRFGVNTLNTQTFINTLNNNLPFIKSNRSGLCVDIIGQKLKNKREENNISLNSLSKKVGVSSRMIVKYEDETSEISFNRAIKIYNIFGSEIFKPINLFFNNNPNIDYKINSEIGNKFSIMGFSTLEIKKLPIDIIAKKEQELIFTGLGDKFSEDIINISKLVDADNLVIFDKKKPQNTPAVSKEEFLDFKNSKELIKFLREFEE